MKYGQINIYKLEKWYFDFLSPDHDFFFFYFARVWFCSYRLEQIYLYLKTFKDKYSFKESLKIKSTDSAPDTTQRAIKFNQGQLQFNASQISVQVDFNKILTSLNFKYSDNRFSGDSLNINKDTGHRISWIPLTLNAEVSGEIQTPERNLKVRQFHGYIDYLTSTILPFQNPVRQLFWGRMQFPGGGLSFTCALGQQPQQRWCKIYMKIKDEYIELNEFDLLPSNWIFSQNLRLHYPANYTITGRSANLHIEIQVENIHSLSELFFIESDGTGCSALYKFSRHLTLNPRGIKFLSRFHFRLEQNQNKEAIGPVIGITEYVVFSNNFIPAS